MRVKHMPHQLDGAFARVNRAAKHIAELKSIVDIFRQAYHDAVASQFDHDRLDQPDLGPRPVPTPEQVGILVGEICYNLRASLDYLVYELAILDSGAVQDNTQFPIYDEEDKTQDFTKRTSKALKGVNLGHKARIEALQPYKDCQWTATLREISNPDKHRRLPGTGRIGRAATVPITLPSPTISTEHIVRGHDGVEMKVTLTTSLQVQIGVKTASNPVVETSVPVVETIEELHSQVTHTLGVFKSEFK